MSSNTHDIARRLDRLESLDAIRQLASRYGMLLDRRDMDALVDLFVDDVRVTRTESGHGPLRELLEYLCRRFTTSVHFIGNHTIDFVDDDHAEGVVYCRAEHEVGDEWIVMSLLYSDRYERRDGRWLFTGRQERHWYAVDVLDRPTGPSKTRWDLMGPEKVPQMYESWRTYWAETAD